jgi:hypothetical protein
MKKYHNISHLAYKRVTQTCAICGFDIVVELHHLDNNHKNNELSNLIGLCPNHHKMAHMLQYKDKISKLICEKNEQKSE